MQTIIEDWDVCLFGLDELRQYQQDNDITYQYQRENDIAYQDYVAAFDVDRSKDWDSDFDYDCFSHHITDDVCDKFLKYCRQPQIKEVITTLQTNNYKITEKIEVIDTKINKLLRSKRNVQNPNSKSLGSINKHISLLQEKKDKLNNKQNHNDKRLEVYNINNFMLYHYKKN